MKLTKSRLKQLIKEEITNLLNEEVPAGTRGQADTSNAIMIAWEDTYRALGYAPGALEIVGGKVQPKKGAFKRPTGVDPLGLSADKPKSAPAIVGTDGKPLLTLAALWHLKAKNPTKFSYEWRRKEDAGPNYKKAWEERERDLMKIAPMWSRKWYRAAEAAMKATEGAYSGGAPGGWDYIEARNVLTDEERALIEKEWGVSLAAETEREPYEKWLRKQKR
jgi:hypothetical protein